MHMSNTICDPGSYNPCFKHATSGAQSFNRLRGFFRSHMRFLRTSNVVPLLAVRAVCLNVKTIITEVTKKSGLEVRLFQKYIQNTGNVNVHIGLSKIYLKLNFFASRVSEIDTPSSNIWLTQCVSSTTEIGTHESGRIHNLIEKLKAILKDLLPRICHMKILCN